MKNDLLGPAFCEEKIPRMQLEHSLWIPLEKWCPKVKLQQCIDALLDSIRKLVS